MHINVVPLVVNKLPEFTTFKFGVDSFNYLFFQEKRVIFQKTQIDQNAEDVNVEATRQLSLGGESELSKQSTSAKKRRTRLRQKIQAR